MSKRLKIALIALVVVGSLPLVFREKMIDLERWLLAAGWNKWTCLFQERE
jgi:hypothetical protein